MNKVRTAALDQSADFCDRFVHEHCASRGDLFELADALLTQAAGLYASLVGPQKTAIKFYEWADDLAAPDLDRRRS